MDIDDFAGPEGMLKLDEICREMATAAKLDELAALLYTKAHRTYEKHEVPKIIAAALASAGPAGIERLADTLRRAPGHIYPLAILEVLWAAASGRPVMASGLNIVYPERTLPAGTADAAATVVDDLIVEAQEDADLYHLLLSLQELEYMGSRAVEESRLTFSTYVMSVIRESSIVLTQRLINTFESLIDQAAPESTYQAFLEEYPVFVDALAAEVHNRARLGVELVTDFVLRRHDARYVVVEIEKPQDPIFTKAGDFSAQFNHAVRQVLDFQGWITSNIAYAQRFFPLIENPGGVVIIGRRAELLPEAQDRLRRWSENSRHLEILTFDDLATRARALLASLRNRPARDLHLRSVS